MDELEDAAREAICSAAERLGVDPFRLARFLAHGKIADFLQAAGHGDLLPGDREKAAGLSQTYLEFLEEEMRRTRDKGPSDAANGG